MSAAPPRGVIPKLFGVTLMSLGALDAMLAWRAGLAGGAEVYLVLLLAGALLYAFGARFRN